MTCKSICAFTVAVLFSIAFSPNRSLAEGYAFAGLSIDKFNVFWQSSVADPTNLAQGPLRDGTGSQVDLRDLNPNGGGGTSNNRRADLESTHATGSFATCLGACSKGPNDYSRPPSQPTDPLSGAKFARTNVRSSGSLFSVGHFTSPVGYDSYAELELNSTATGKTAAALGSYQSIRFFRVVDADRMVFDFDADVFMRVFRESNLPLARVDARTTFQIKLTDSAGNTMLDFSPNGSELEQIGGDVVADPFNLNRDLAIQPPYGASDLEIASAGQFRVISPLLTPDVSYVLTVTSGSAVNANNVPEPASAAFALIAIISRMFARKRRSG
ncbi:MAG: EDSAP-1 family PEP-CTERM protein [Pirellulales bacterium]